MANRLKTMRKIRRKTQKEIADFIGITQNAYSYWENDRVRIDNESLTKLASYYNVSLDFLAGRKYIVNFPIDTWHPSLQEDYYSGDIFLKEYMEYRYGNISYIDDNAPEVAKELILFKHGKGNFHDTQESNLSNKTDQKEKPTDKGELSKHEAAVLNAYRNQPEMQPAVDKLLGIYNEEYVQLYTAASSKDNRPDEFINMPKEKWEKIKNTPDTDDSLM